MHPDWNTSLTGARLAGSPRWPSLFVCMWLTLGIALLTSLLTITLTPVAGGTAVWWRLAIQLGIVLLLLAAPGVTAAYSAYVMAGYLDSAEYQTVRLAGLFKRDIVRGCHSALLYRLRLLYVVSVGLVPALIIAMTDWLQSVPVGALVVVGAAGLVLMNGLAAAVGLAISARLRMPLYSALAAATAMLISPLAIAAFVLISIQTTFAASAMLVCLAGWITVFWLSSPYYLTERVLRRAEKWV